MGEDGAVSTTAQVVLITGLVLGIVAVMLVAIYLWDRFVKDTAFARGVDRMFDRISDLLGW